MDGEQHRREFRKALSGVLNYYGKDTETGMPDFILAEMLCSQLMALANAVDHTSDFYKTEPEQIATPPDKGDAKTKGGG